MRRPRLSTWDKILLFAIVVFFAISIVLFIRDGTMTVEPFISISVGFSTVVSLGWKTLKRKTPTIPDLDYRALREQLNAEARDELRAANLSSKSSVLSQIWRRVDGLDRRSVDDASSLSHVVIERLTEQIASQPSNPFRIFIIGDMGAGKTVALRQLQRDISETGDSEHARCLPVVVHLADWNGANMETWLRSHLSLLLQIEPVLVNRAFEARNIALLVDGLDEIDIDSAEKATRAIRELARLEVPVVVTCRTERYREILSSDLAINDSRTFSIEPTPLDEAVVYLHNVTSRFSGTEEAITYVENHPDSALSTLLRDPIWLRIYSLIIGNRTKVRHVEAAILTTPPLDRPEAQRQLLSHFVSDTFDHAMRRGVRGREISYDRTASLRWIQSIAAFTVEYADKPVSGVRLPIGLIVPQQLWPIVGVRLAQTLVTVLSLLLFLPVIITLRVMCVRYDLHGPQYVLIWIVLIVLMVGALGMNLSSIRAFKVDWSKIYQIRALARAGVLITFAFLALAVLAMVTRDWRYALVFGAGFSAAYIFGFTFAVRPTMNEVKSACAATLVEIILGSIAWTIFGDTDLRLLFVGGVIGGAVTLVVYMVVATVIFGRAGRSEVPAGFLRGPDPFGRLRSDAVSGVVVFFVATSLTLVASYSTSLLPLSMRDALLLSLFAGVAAGPGLIAVGSRRYAVTLIASFRRYLPFTLRRFLLWAWNAGLLRRSAAAYQFRHETLRSFFASEGSDLILSIEQQD